MNSSNIQEQAAFFTTLIILVILLVTCRLWCLRVAKKVADGRYEIRAALTRRILRGMTWRVAVAELPIGVLAVMRGDANQGAKLLESAIICYPLVLLSLWQVARRVSKAVFEAISAEQHSHEKH